MPNGTIYGHKRVGRERNFRNRALSGRSKADSSSKHALYGGNTGAEIGKNFRNHALSGLGKTGCSSENAIYGRIWAVKWRSFSNHAPYGRGKRGSSNNDAVYEHMGRGKRTAPGGPPMLFRRAIALPLRLPPLELAEFFHSRSSQPLFPQGLISSLIF